MFQYVYWLLACFFVVGLIFLSVDFYYWFIDRYSRYRIGRWQNHQSWIKRYNRTVIKWLPKTPPVQISDNTHLILWDKITGKFSRNCVQSWQTAGLVLGACEYTQNDTDELLKKCTKHFIDTEGMWRKKPTNVDNSMLAFSLLKYSKRSEFIRPAMDYMISIVEKFISDEDQMIIYNQRTNLRYVDTLGLVCPFLVLYAKIYKEHKYQNLAYEQIRKFNKVGLFQNTYLPAHAYEINSKLPMGVYGWGRGTGWYIIGVLDSFIEMSDSDEKNKLRSQLLAMADFYARFQRQDGGFGTFLQDKKTYDSSATAIFAYFYACCHDIFVKNEYAEISRRSLDMLKSKTRMSGKLDNCQGDTKDVGIFSTRYDSLPFAQGFGLRAYAKIQDVAAN
ncbi:hypothetical protein LNTAR_14512 [Lentisphaera araneosa HTCC2155]|uniref:Glycosyl hydrolase, family 88 n=1 Tax=Lentisphaera araneosa HTCC2155 TaxID=313628 RepID=A6DHF4_9BACT|nr:glycoside hydrolase family 88 protein [Lentisphaera araneosa]EDM29037.1 hypothetical protein LNTAR_14512 [Lentisphaera araneosa HTCC2155]